jgi:citrate synthase
VAEKGLREVVAAQTRISDIDGEQGRLWYVGFEIAELAERATFEEVVYLLHHLELPNEQQLETLRAFLADEREPAHFQNELMPTLAQQTSPMSMLRTSVSSASTYDPDGWDFSTEANLRKALRLIALMPSFIAMYHRAREGNALIPPNPKLSHAANFLTMLLGEEPDELATHALDTTFILYADHTMNASTFTARIIASTLSDLHSAITGAIGALKGPLHGGANEEAMKMIEEVGTPDGAAAYVRDRLSRKEKIMGFGHAVYRGTDPRATVLRGLARQTSERAGTTQLFETAEAIERITFEEKGLYPNVDFYAAVVYNALGIPTDLMTPIFALARTAGWTAHVREQYADNKVIRPGSEYIGPRDRAYVPIEQRP